MCRCLYTGLCCLFAEISAMSAYNNALVATEAMCSQTLSLNSLYSIETGVLGGVDCKDKHSLCQLWLETVRQL